LSKYYWDGDDESFSQHQTEKITDNVYYAGGEERASHNTQIDDNNFFSFISEVNYCVNLETLKGLYRSVVKGKIQFA
jgi:hypothetical protein